MKVKQEVKLKFFIIWTQILLIITEKVLTFNRSTNFKGIPNSTHYLADLGAFVEKIMKRKSEHTFRIYYSIIFI